MASGGDSATSTSGVRTTLPAGGGGALTCSVAFAPSTNSSAAYYEVPVTCGKYEDTLRLLRGETALELRLFTDWTFTEAFFQQGRVAFTVNAATDADADVSFASDADATVASAVVYPMRGIWTTPDAVRNAPRVYK